MLETLLKILSWDIYSPEIMLDDNNILLDWHDYHACACIDKDGIVNWAIIFPEDKYKSKEYSAHGTDLEEFRARLEEKMK